MSDAKQTLLLGLPAVLLENQCQVLSDRLQKLGLNRARKRDELGKGPCDKDLLARFGLNLPELDGKLLTYEMQPWHRFFSYWFALGALHERKRAARTYLSIDFANLREFEPDFLDLPVDEAALERACPVWPSIRQLLLDEPSLQKNNLTPRFNAFMLWPRVAAGLDQWETLDAAAKRDLVLVAFSLSSISTCDWFVMNLVTRREELSAEILELVGDELLAVSQANPAADAAAVEPDLQPDADDTDGAAEPEAQAELGWPAACERLLALASRVKEEASAQAIEDLWLFVPQLRQLWEKEQRLALAKAQFESALAGVLDKLGVLAERPEFNWLFDFVPSQLNARWRLHYPEEEASPGFQADIARAHTAIESETHAYGALAAELQHTRASVGEVDAALGGAASPREKQALKSKRSSLRIQESQQESALQLKEADLLSAASPMGEPFDQACDYQEQWQLLQGIQIAPETQQPDETPASSDDDDASEPDAPSEPSERTEPHAALDADGGGQEGAPDDAEPVAVEPAMRPAAPPPEPLIEFETTADAAAVCEEAQIVAPPAVAPAMQEPTQAPAALSAPAALQPADPATEHKLPLPVTHRVWEAISDGDVSWAYQRVLVEAERDANVPTAPLLACLALADHVVFPEGRIGAALETYYQELKADYFVRQEASEFGVAVNLLLVAATLKPMVLAPASGAAAVARYLHLDQQHLGIYGLVQVLLDHSERLQGFRLEAQSFKGAKTKAAWDKELAELQDQVREWGDRAPHMTMLFSAAAHVWQHWQRPGALIESLLRPVQRGDFSQLEEVKARIASLSTAGNIEKEVAHTDRKELKRSRGEDIQSRALTQLMGRVEEALRFARRWVLLVEARPVAGDVLNKRLDELRADLDNVAGDVSRDLASLAAGDLIAAAKEAVRRSVDALHKLFDPTEPPDTEETEPEKLLARDLLKIPAMDMSADWQPDVPPGQLAQTLDGDMLEWFSAFETRLQRNDLEGGERICDLLASELALEDANEMRRSWTRALEDNRSNLRRHIQGARETLEQSLACGLISEAELSKFEADLVGLSSTLDEIRRFGAAFDNVSRIEEAVRSSGRKRIALIRARFAELQERQGALEGMEFIEDALSRQDALTANELLQRMEAGGPVGAVPSTTLDRFNAFFPRKATEIDQALEQLPHAELLREVRGGQTFAGVNFGDVPGPQLHLAAEMLKSWYEIKTRKRVEPEPLKRLLQGLGLDILEIRVGQPIGSRVECDISAVPTEDRSICPVAYFGSHAEGRYRIICLWQRPAEEDLVKLVGDSSLSRPTLVLYLGRLTERKRRDTSRLAKQQHKSFLLLDESLLVFLCGESGSRLAAFFETALPFAYSTPYDATSSVVPTEMFFGRTEELQAVQGQNGRCFIYGGRQLGKTALLRKAEKSFHSPKEGRHSKWIDLRAEGIGVNRGPEEIWLCVAREFKRLGIVPNDMPDPTPGMRGRVDGFLATLREAVALSARQRVLLLLDEADSFFEKDGQNDFAETRRLKQLMEDSERRFKVVFAGLHNVLRMTERANHPLAHFGEPIKIGPLLEGPEWKDAEDLVRKPFEAAGFEFESPNLVTRILAQTNYYPSLIQLYCSHLLRKMLSVVLNDVRLQGPRYVIRGKHLDDVYGSRALRDEIRSKFHLTLQLDPRYEVIAYTLAHGVLSGSAGPGEGMGQRELKERAYKWWPEGFSATSDLEFRILVEEMVGLGVLRQAGAGVALRNPNVLLLLGGLQDIEDVLIKDRELPQEFESETFRARKSGDTHGVMRHPLTFSQLNLLTRAANETSVLAGSDAAGLPDLISFLRASPQEEYLVVLDEVTDLASFTKALEGLKKRPEGGTTLIIVPPSVPWTRRWVADAHSRLARLTSRNKHAHVLFVLDAASAWSTLRDEGGLDWEHVSVVTLQRWQDAYVRQWLQDCGFPDDPGFRTELKRVTGFWPFLLYEFADLCRGSTRPRDALARLSARFDDAAYRHTTEKRMALDNAETRAVLHPLAELGTATASDLALLSDKDRTTVDLALAWSAAMGLAQRDSLENWTLDPVAQRLLKSAQGNA